MIGTYPSCATADEPGVRTPDSRSVASAAGAPFTAAFLPLVPGAFAVPNADLARWEAAAVLVVAALAVAAAFALGRHLGRRGAGAGAEAGVRDPRAGAAAGHAPPCDPPRDGRYRLFFEASPLPMWVFDSETLRFLAVNQAAVRKYGYSAEEFSRMTILEIRPPADEEAVLRSVRERRFGFHASGVWRHLLRDGTPILVEVTTHDIEYDGRPARLVAVNDVSERERAIELARQAEERQRFAMNAAGVAVWELDLHTGRLTWSDELYRFLGLDPDTAPASLSAFLRLVHREDRPELVRKARAAAEGGWEHSIDFRIVRPGGEVRWVGAHGRNVMDEEGRPLRLIGIASDVTRRKRVEAELRQREQQLVQAQRIARLGSWEMNVETGEIVWSDEMYTIFQRDPADGPVGREEYGVQLHPEDRERGVRQDDLATQQGGWSVQHRYTLPDGTLAVFNIRGSFERDALGKPVRIVGTVQDVTDLRALEEAIRASEERYRLLSQVTHEVIWEWNPVTREVTCNQMLTPVFGYESSDEMGRIEWWLDNIHPQDRERVLDALTAVMEDGGESWSDEFRFRRSDGGYADVLGQAVVVRGPDGGPLRVIGSTSDISDRRRAEHALRESEERFRQIAENVREVFYMTDVVASQVIYLSPAFEEIWGQPRSTVYRERRAWTRTIHPGDRERVQAALAVDEGKHLNVEYRITRPDGTIRWIWARHFPVEDETGRLVRIAGLAEDVTDRKLAEQERAELLQRAEAARRQAEYASQAKSDFLAVVSHELRTPLTSIISFAELLDGGVAGPVTEEQRDQLGMISRSAWHLNSLVGEILEFTRLEGGHEVVHREPVELGALIAETASLVAPAAAERGLVVAATVPKVGVVFDTDSGKLRQILLNLLSNAIKFTDEGQVVVSLEVDDGSARITVEDSGPGIAPEHQAHIFEPFWQVEDPMTRRVGGAGLGLSIVQHLTNLLGGEVTVQTRPGEGSRFTVSLPRAELTSTSSPQHPGV
jgi:PAS domain S-box-containing protein